MAHADLMGAIKKCCESGIPQVMQKIANVIHWLLWHSEYLIDKNPELAHELFDLLKPLFSLEDTADNSAMKAEVAYAMGQFAYYKDFWKKW